MHAPPRSLGIAGCVLAVLSGGCAESPRMGIPRVPLSAASPDGRYVAFVRNHPSIDPPNQSLWIAPQGGEPRQIQKLGEDTDWCDLIVWSADSSTVVFLIQDSRVLAFDAPSNRVIFDQTLTASNGEYPAAHVVRDLSVTDRGTSVTFRTCARNAPTRPAGAPSCGPAERRIIRPA